MLGSNASLGGCAQGKGVQMSNQKPQPEQCCGMCHYFVPVLSQTSIKEGYCEWNERVPLPEAVAQIVMQAMDPDDGRRCRAFEGPTVG